MLALRAGRFPSAPNEVALTDGWAATFGVHTGEAVLLGGVRRTMVGIVENPGALDDDFALVAPSANPKPDAMTVLVRASDGRVRSFRSAEDPGVVTVQSRGQTEKTSAALLVLAVATVAMLLVSLVAAAGFITLAHRRLRQLGMLAAVGATHRHLRLVVIINGAAVGVVAALAGTVAALAAWVGLAPAFETAARHRISRTDVPWWLIAASIGLAVTTSTAAAWWPARSVARTSITQALWTRPPHPKTAHRSALLAVFLLAGGVAGIALGNDPPKDQNNPLLFIPGVLATATAVLVMALPALRGVALLARRLPVAPRLAIRDLARYQARSGAALGAISLGLAIAVSIVVVAAAAVHHVDEGNLPSRTLVLWTHAPEHASSGAPWESSRSAYGALVPEATADELDRYAAVAGHIADSVDSGVVVPLDVAVDPTLSAGHDRRTLRRPVAQARRVGSHTLRDSGTVFVATPQLLAYLDIDHAAADSKAVLLTAQTDPVYLAGDLTSSVYRHDPVPAAAVQRVRLPHYSSMPHALITRRGLRDASLIPMRAGWLIQARGQFTDAQLAVARKLAADSGLAIESRDKQPGLAMVRTAASVAGVFLALGILAMTVGLIRGEAARDLHTLAVAGATNRTRRTLAATTAGVLAALGAVLGSAGAYAALVAGYWPDAGRLANVPVMDLTLIAIGLPVLAAAATWTIAGREPTRLARHSME
jgi:putative ABC transport system permease protein